MGGQDSTPVGQDDAARLNGLMGSLGKRTSERDQALARVSELEAVLQGQAQGQQAPGQTSDAAGNSQPNLEDGEMYEVVDGQLVHYEPPTPRRNNPARDTTPRDRDDGSVNWARAQVAKAVGGGLPKTSWP